MELHVHLEGTIRPATLLAIAKRNGEPLPADSVEGLERLYDFSGIREFVRVWILTTNCLRTRDDFREVLVDYAAEAASHGAVYVEAVVSPAERVALRGLAWDTLLGGYCDGIEEARERHGVEVRLTPDLYRGMPAEDAEEAVRQTLRFRDRGVVGVGIGGDERAAPTAHYARAFAMARDGGLPAVPHAGETTDAVAVRDALDILGAHRIRHGIKAVEDAGLLRELAGRGTVLDVCPTSNLRLSGVPSLAEHPLPGLLEAGVPVSIGTDDPAMFGTDLSCEHDVARGLGASPRALYDDAVAGALCDDVTRARLVALGAAATWPG